MINYRWSITFRNCDLLYCTLVIYIILYLNYTSIKMELCHRAMHGNWQSTLSLYEDCGEGDWGPGVTVKGDSSWEWVHSIDLKGLSPSEAAYWENGTMWAISRASGKHNRWRGGKGRGRLYPFIFPDTVLCQRRFTPKRSAHVCYFVALSSVCVWIPAGVSKFRSQLQSFLLHFPFT